MWGSTCSIWDERRFPPPKERSLTVYSKADSFRPSMSNGSVNLAPHNRRRLSDLYDRARTLEQQEEQYVASAASKGDTHRSNKRNEQTSQSPRDPAGTSTDRQDSGTDPPLPTTSSNSQTDRRCTHPIGRFRGGHRDNQQRRESRPPQEAPGRSENFSYCRCWIST